MTTVSNDTIRFACPVCGESVRLTRPINYSHDEFCNVCDFPLFWSEQAKELLARPSTVDVPAPTADPVADPAPVVETVACPECAAANALGAAYCSACGADIVPAAPARSVA